MSDVYLVLTFVFPHADAPTSPNSSYIPAVPTSPTDAGNRVKKTLGNYLLSPKLLYDGRVQQAQAYIIVWLPFRLFAAVSPTEKITGAAAFAFQNLETIKHKFADFQTKVCTRLSKNGVDIHQFLQYAKSRFHPGYFIPLSPTNLTEIFDSITDHGMWDYFHCSPLLHVVQTFGAGDPEMKVWVQSYMKDLKSYRSVKKIEAFIESDNDELDASTEPPPARRAKYDSRYCCQMEWKTRFGTDHTLEYLTDVWEMFSLCYLDPDSPQTALLDRIREGCISVTWLIPSYLVPQLTKRAKINTKFFQKHGILKVTVSDQCIYEEETSKENGPVSINSYLVGCHIVALCVRSCELSNAFILCAQLLLSYSMFQCLEYSLDQ